ncbi:MAG: glycosyltransferase [Rubellimicrobium sp.]|nr:glycosyltransferase [Rubellimicrobium sp.]
MAQGATRPEELRGLTGPGRVVALARPAPMPLPAPAPAFAPAPAPAFAPAFAPPSVDPCAEPADAGLVALLGAGRCLRAGILPWRRVGGAVVILAPDEGALVRHAALLAPLGPLRFAPCPTPVLRAGLRQAAGALLVHEAETRTPDADSCRTLPLHQARRLLPVLAVLVPLVLAWPVGALAIGVTCAAVALLLTASLRLAALCASRLRPPDAPDGTGPVPARLPVISLLVPLLHETGIARTLMARLEALDYPRDRLDLCLILEEADTLTRDALMALDLPAHAQVIEVPRGTLCTKPRALNFALDFAQGSIIGIYDAEDRPEPDQLLQVARRFARAGPDVACLQGVLDYYNHGSNWLARCFTLEYGSWFRVILPGMVRLGLAIPLGGTTLFLRRHAIEAVGGWDAHNVTEDADLGIRLYRRGYRTEMLDTVTAEEANARAWPWIRQRTRWLKGYALTWAVHMRDPRRLWHELGAWRFLGVQVVFLGTLSQFLLAPLLLALWFLPLLGAVPFPRAAIWALLGLFLMAEGVNAVAAGLGAIRSGKARLMTAIPLLHLYFPMATVAAWRALAQILVAPFHWEKTAHGIFAPTRPPLGAALTRPAGRPRRRS